MRQFAKLVVLQLLRAYKWAISPMLPPSCRFVPTCSEYAMEAVDRYGVLRGGLMALARLLRCHPLAHAGYDPVVKDGKRELEEKCGATTRGNASAAHTVWWKLWWKSNASVTSRKNGAFAAWWKSGAFATLRKRGALATSWKSRALAPRHVLKTLMGFSPRARLLHLKRNA